MPSHAELLNHLIELAKETLAHFDARELDAALANDAEYDRIFAELQQLVTTSPFTAAHVPLIAQLDRLHSQCFTRARETRDQVQGQLGELAQSKKVLQYAPAGDGQHRAPRYLDASA